MPRKSSLLLILGAAGLLVLVILWNNITTIVESGEKGVIFRPFSGGLEKDKQLGQGFHLIAPWNDVFKYDVKVQESTSIMEVLSKNGLTIKLEVSYWYRADETRIGYLHDEIGLNYHSKIVAPAMRSATREVIGKYLPEELYSSKREVIEDEMLSRARRTMEGKYITLDDVLIRDVSLPQSLRDAIEKKLKQEQASLEYEFRLEQAEKEAERQRIEAEGKAKANNIVSQSLTDKILREKGIGATLKLSESNNAKVVVIGSSKDGLPLILGDN
ncbi:MAG: prohibitin family protein [Cryomorphaceae bacterium]|nr:prohibitin family protein [Cryomorphaceae bacterium]